MVKHFLRILVQNENSVQMNAILKVYLNVKLKLVLYVEKYLAPVLQKIKNIAQANAII